MATIGPLYPATAVEVATAPYNGIAWVGTSIVNIYADDTSYGSIVAPQYDTGVICNLLVGRNFGATVPTDATVDGLLLEVGKWYSAGSARDAIVTIYDGSIVGSNLGSTGIAWPASIGTVSYGGSANKWGITPTPAQVNGTGFGFGISAIASADNTDIWIDFMRMTVYYTPSLSVNGTAAQNFQAQVSDISTLGVWTPIAPAENKQVQVSDISSLSYAVPEIAIGQNWQAQVSEVAGVTFSGGVTYTPQTSVLDDFNRADENPLNPTLWGGPFADGQGVWKIVSNQAIPVG